MLRRRTLIGSNRYPYQTNPLDEARNEYAYKQGDPNTYNYGYYDYYGQPYDPYGYYSGYGYSGDPYYDSESGQYYYPESSNPAVQNQQQQEEQPPQQQQSGTDWANTAGTTAGSAAGAYAAGSAAGQGTAYGMSSTGAVQAGWTGAGAGAPAASSSAAAAPWYSSLASMWPLAALYGAYRVYDKTKNYSKDGAMTDSQIHMALNPRGIETILQKVPGHKWLKSMSPEFLLWKGLFGSTKGEDQILRDRVRGLMQENGLIDEGYQITLANGSKFDIGKDGSEKLYNLDHDNPKVAQYIGLADPLTAIITGGDPKLTSDFTGYFVNAAMSSGDPMRNLQYMWYKAGFKTKDSATAAVQNLFDQGLITSATLEAYMNSINVLFSYRPKKKEQPKGK